MAELDTPTTYPERPAPPGWSALLAHRRGAPLHDCPEPLRSLYAGVLAPAPADRCRVIGHLAQSLDGRIAAADGQSQWISGEADLDHTHRLRALCDAVLVGAETAAVDRPSLTVRRVAGPQPLRVVLDPQRRVPLDTLPDPESLLVIHGARVDHSGPGQGLALPAPGGRIDPRAVAHALAAQGVERLLVEGGGYTLSSFLASGCLDLLHLVIAPIWLGDAGRPGLALPGAPSLQAAPRLAMALHELGPDALLAVRFG